MRVSQAFHALCGPCQSTRELAQPEVPKLRPQRLPRTILSRWIIDTTRMPSSPSGFIALWVAKDPLSKSVSHLLQTCKPWEKGWVMGRYVVIYPLRDLKASTSAACLDALAGEFGLAHTICTDNGHASHHSSLPSTSMHLQLQAPSFVAISSVSARSGERVSSRAAHIIRNLR